MNDADLLQAFETHSLPLAEFRHCEHVRLAYIYLTLHSFEVAKAKFKRHLLDFLSSAGAPASQYHETMTHAWLLAVNHFLHRVGPKEDSESFLAECACLLDERTLLSHYTPERLDLPLARKLFVDPALEPIPR